MKKKVKKMESKLPRITIKKSLSEYKGKIIFKTTFLKAQEALKNVKLPETITGKSESI